MRIRTKFTLLTGALLGFVLSGPHRADAASPQGVEAGRLLAEKHCARCHAVGRTGESPGYGVPPFRVIAARGNVDNLQEALAEGIMVGHPEMPEFTFEPREIAAFLDYLKSLAPEAK